MQSPCYPTAQHVGGQRRRGCRKKASMERPPKAILKKTSVSGVAAGWFKKVRMGIFFFIFFSKNGQYFPTEKKKIKEKKTKNAALLLASKKDTRWTGNRSFF